MSKKLILIIICLLVITGCGKSNQLEINNSKVKDTLVYHETIDEDYGNSDLLYSEIIFNFDKDNKLISINTIGDYDYSETPYNIEVLKKGIETKNAKCKYGKSNVIIKDKSQNILRFDYLTDIQKIREDLKNADDKEKFYENYDDEKNICGLFPLGDEMEYLEYGKEEWEKLINSEDSEDDDVLNIESPTIKTDGSYYSDSGSIMWVKFSEDKKILVEYDTGCTEDMPCGGYAEKGTYVIEENKIIATLTQAEDIEWYDLDKSKKLTFTIINENQIETDTQVFNYR